MLGFSIMQTKNFQMSNLGLKQKSRGIKDQIANILWIIEKAREFQKNIYLCFMAMLKPLTVWIITNWKALKDMGIPHHLTCPLRNLYVNKQQWLEPCMEQLTGSRLRKEYHRAVCCHPVCLTHMLSTSEKSWAG